MSFFDLEELAEETTPTIPTTIHAPIQEPPPEIPQEPSSPIKAPKQSLSPHSPSRPQQTLPLQSPQSLPSSSPYMDVKNLFLPPKNIPPIRYVDFIERNYPYFFTNLSEDSSFLLSSYKSKHDIKCKLLSFSEDSTTLNKLLFSENEENPITCTLMFLNYLITGNSIGIVRVYSCKLQKLIKTFNLPDNEQTYLTQQISREITAIDISSDGSYLVSGYSNGCIALWFVDACTLVHFIKDVHEYGIVAIKILSSFPKKKWTVLSSDRDGNVVKITIEKKLFGIKVDHVSIYHKPQITYIIEILKPFKDENFVLAALGNYDVVKLYLLEPNVQASCEFKRPENVATNAIPDVSFGKGCEPKMDRTGFIKYNNDLDSEYETKTYVMLAISWDKLIRIYSFTIDENGVIALLNQGNPSGYFLNTYMIIRIGFLSTSIIYFFDAQKQIKVFNTALVHAGDYIPSNTNDNYSMKALIEEGTVIDPDILNIDISFKGERFMSYRNFITNTQKRISLFCKKNYYRGQLLNYKESISHLITNDNWLDALCVGIDIYRGALISFPDIPLKDEDRKKEVVPFLKQMVIDYINSVLKVSNKQNTAATQSQMVTSMDDYNKCMTISIEFCISIKAVDFLFADVQDALNGYCDDLIKDIEPFFFADKFKNEKISSSTISSLFATYASRRDLCVLSHVIPHLDFESICHPFVKESARKYRLYTTMIYLMSNSDDPEDNFKPISEMFSFFTTYNTNAVNKEYIINLSDFNYDYTEVYKQRGLSFLEQTRCFIGHKLLWYIDLCLNGKKLCFNINDNESFDVNSNMYHSLICRIYTWMLRSEVFNTLLEFDAFSLLCLFSKFYTYNYLYTIIKEFDFMSLPNEYTTEERDIHTDEIENINIDFQKQHLSKYNNVMLCIKYIIYKADVCMKDANNSVRANAFLIKHDIDVFIVKVASHLHNGIIEHNEVVRAVLNVINYFNDMKRCINDIVDVFRCHGVNEDSNSDNVKQYRNELSKTLLNILSSPFEFTNDELQSLYTAALDSPFIYVVIAVLEKLKDYKEALKMYFIHEKDIGINEIYKWIEQTFKALTSNKQNLQNEHFIKLKNSLLDHLSTKTEIANIDAVVKILNEWYKDDSINNLRKINNIELQYKILELFINDKKSRFACVTDPNEIAAGRVKPELVVEYRQILMFHFDILITMNKPQDLLNNLYKRFKYYDHEECLAKCLKHKWTEHAIMIYNSTGEYAQAHKLSLSNMQDAFDNIVSGAITVDNGITLIETHIKTSIRTIIEYNEKSKLNKSNTSNIVDNVNNSNKMWFDILEKFLSFHTAAKHNSTLKMSIQKVIQHFLRKMCFHVSLQEIFQNIINGFEGTEFNDFKPILSTVLTPISNYIKVIGTAKDLLYNVVVSSIASSKQLIKTGKEFSLNKCEICKKKFSNEPNEMIMMFQCGHTMHSRCNERDCDYVVDEGNAMCAVCRRNELYYDESVGVCRKEERSERDRNKQNEVSKREERLMSKMRQRAFAKIDGINEEYEGKMKRIEKTCRINYVKMK